MRCGTMRVYAMLWCATLQEALDEASALAGAGKRVYVANYMFPQGRTVSGHAEARAQPCEPAQPFATRRAFHGWQALARLCELLPALTGKEAAMLPVSGAFHTPMMGAASQDLGEALDAAHVRPARAERTSARSTLPRGRALRLRRSGRRIARAPACLPAGAHAVTHGLLQRERRAVHQARVR